VAPPQSAVLRSNKKQIIGPAEQNRHRAAFFFGGSVALGAKKKPGFLKAGLLRFRLKASD